MSTPAEIIAARVNGTYVEKEEPAYIEPEQSRKAKSTPPPLISDDLAFPTLGGGKRLVASSAATSWGPQMKAPAVAPAPVKARPANGNTPKLSTIQDAFSLDVDDQIQVARPEFIRILTQIKTETQTSIESLISSLKRTFLISGKPENVKLAKRLVIRKLTKPVQIQFTVPAKLRSRIIGQGGKNLRPIVAQNQVKIDVANYEGDDDDEDDEDVFSKTIPIVIEGDAEGAKRAKAQILAIVTEETKNLAAKLAIDELVKPFAQFVLNPVVESYPDLDFSIPTHKQNSSRLSIVGDREQVLAAKEAAQRALDAFAPKITTTRVPIPQVKHQFLPIDQILDEDQVFIKLPGPEETDVQFIGEKSRIAAAQEKARKTTLQYKVEVLDMLRAHGGNLNHVKAVASLLSTNGRFNQIASEQNVKISVPSKRDLAKDILLIPIEIIAKNDQQDEVKRARSQIVATVNQITPAYCKHINDINSFLIPRVEAELAEASKSNNVKVIVLGDNVFLFANTDDLDDDFVDAEDIARQLDAVDAALSDLRKSQADLHTAVIDVPLADHEHVRGPRSTTLNLILLGVDNDVRVTMGAPHDDAISILGFKNDVEVIRKQIELAVADAKEHGNLYLTLVSIPSQVVLRFIGKQGANLNQLRDEFGIKIDVPERDDNSDKVDVELTGIKRNVEAAKQKVTQLAKKLADETISRIKIEQKYHRRMIGSNGIYINRLQDKYNVQINFPRASNGNATPDGVKADEVVIKGPSKGVAKAEEELLELYAFEKENGFTETLKIPGSAVARVIGKGGEVIRDISDGTGVEYKFKRDKEAEEASGYAELELTGSKLALKEAKAKIQEIIDEVENFVQESFDVDPKYHRDLIGPNGLVMRDILTRAGAGDMPRNRKYYQLLTIPNEGLGELSVTSAGDKEIVQKVMKIVKEIVAEREALVTEEYELPKEKHKLIVGPGGSIRHAIQDETGANIEIPRPNDPSLVLKLLGTPEKIAAAKAKIEELTKDDWNVEVPVPAKYHHLVSERGAVFKQLQNKLGVDVVHGPHTRKASNLSKTPIPAAPEEAFPTGDLSTQFVIVPAAAREDDDAVIPWRLKGSEEATAKAAEQIKARLALAEAADHEGWFYAQNPSVFSKIIGPGGSRVSDIRNQTGTFITIPRQLDKNGNLVYLVGTKDNLTKAQEAITKLV